MSGFPLLTTIIAAPALAALVIMAIPPQRKTAIRTVAMLGALLSAALTFAVVLRFDFATAGAGVFQLVERHAWIRQLGIDYYLAVDGIGVAMLILTAIIIVTGVLVSWGEIKDRPKEFFALLLLLVSGVYGVFVSYDLFLFFLFYEVAVLPMYLLIGVWGSQTYDLDGKIVRTKEYSAMKLTLYLMLGSAFILVGFLAFYFAAGKGTFDYFALQQAGFSKTFQLVVFPLVFIGFGILGGLWPFHTWSPDGHASAPTAVSMLHAGVLMKLGAYGVLRMAIAMMPAGAEFWGPIFLLFTLVNIVYGSIGALHQTDLKYVIAYSSVSHMGIVLFGLCTLTPLGLNGAVLQMFSHGIMTGLLFALVGSIYGRTHTRMIPYFGGFARKMPFLAVAFAIAAFCSLGLPGMSGFVAELLVFLGGFKAYPLQTALAATGIVFTALYILRVVQRMFFGPVVESSHGFDFSGLTDAGAREKLALGILIATLLVVGMYPYPMVKLIDQGVVDIMSFIRPDAAVTSLFGGGLR